MGLFLKKKDFAINSNGIDSVEKIKLGGVEQSVLIQAQDPTNPVLLIVHGGPCMPIPGVVSRGQDYAIATTTKELVQHFVLVFWDQRGAGKSYNRNTPAESFRVDQYVSDCIELIDVLRERFQQEKIFLAGYSWGTVIGLIVAARHPAKLYAYVGISQLVNWVENDSICYEWVRNKAKESHDKKILKLLDELGLPPYTKNVKQWSDFRSPLMKYKSMIYESDTIKHPGIMGAFKLFFNSSEYSLIDIYHTFTSAYRLTYTQELIEDFSKINLAAIRKICVPVYFLHGRQDVHVNYGPVENFFKQLDAPSGKKLVWYEHSSHMFHPDDAKAIEQFFIDVVKPESLVCAAASNRNSEAS